MYSAWRKWQGAYTPEVTESMKLTGILCIILACTGAGIYAARKLRQEVTAYERLISLAESCAAYIRCQSPELDELLAMLAEHPAYSSFHFLKAVSEKLSPETPPSALWNAAVCNDDAVPKGAQEILCSLGTVLGTTDTTGQISAIELHCTRLKRAAEESRECFQRQGKLYRSLGLLGGAMLAVMLL